MIKVGLTGGIGSGKSTVAKFWRLLGIPTYSSDERARQIMNSDTQVIQAIKHLLGTQAYNSEGLDRAFVASKIFNDKELLSRLNGIVHPAVEQDFELWSSRQSAPYVIEESAILFESRAARLMDFNVVVTASLENRITRTMLRNNISREQVIERISNQMPQQEIISMCDFRIENDDQLLIPQIINIDQTIRERIKQK